MEERIIVVQKCQAALPNMKKEWSKFWLQPCYKVRKPNGSWNGIRGVKIALFEPITNPKDLSLTGTYQVTTQTPLNGMTQMEDNSQFCCLHEALEEVNQAKNAWTLRILSGFIYGSGFPKAKKCNI